MASIMIGEEKNAECLKAGMKKYTKQDLMRQIETAPNFKFGGEEFKLDLNEPNSPDDFFSQKAKAELRETPEIIALGLKEFKEMIAGEPNFYMVDDDDLFYAYLRPCKWYARSAFEAMKLQYRLRQKYSYMFTDALPSKITKAICSNLMYPSPFRTKDGCRVFVIEAGSKWNPSEVSKDDMFKGVMLFLYGALWEPKTQIAGVHIIFDLNGLNWNHILHVTPSFAKMMLDFIQNAVPVRLKSINVVNQSFFFDIIFMLFKPFLQEKFRNRIHFHGTNWESLASVIDKRVLFTQYGGDVELSDDSIGMNLWKLLRSCERFFEVHMELGYRTENHNK